VNNRHPEWRPPEQTLNQMAFGTIHNVMHRLWKELDEGSRVESPRGPGRRTQAPADPTMVR